MAKAVDLADQIERAIGLQDALFTSLQAKLAAKAERIKHAKHGLGVLAVLNSSVEASNIVVRRPPRVVLPKDGTPGYVDTSFRLEDGSYRSGVVRRYAGLGRIGLTYWEGRLSQGETLQITNIDAPEAGKPVTMKDGRIGSPRVSLGITYDAIDDLAHRIEALAPAEPGSTQEQ